MSSQNDYNIFTSDLENYADPMRTDLFSVYFYNTMGFAYRYPDPEANQFYPFRTDLPKQSNVLCKRWYFGTYRQDVINSDRGGEITMEFYMRCQQKRNLKLLQFLGVPIENEFLDNEQRYKHVEFNKQFDKIEIVTRDNTFEDGMIYTLYNCNVKEVSLTSLDASSTEILRLTATVTYDTFDAHESKESRYRDDIGRITREI